MARNSAENGVYSFASFKGRVHFLRLHFPHLNLKVYEPDCINMIMNCREDN